MSVIYGLIDGDTMELRYVGQTIYSPEGRLRAHSAHGVAHLRSWLRSVNASVIVLERDPEDLNEAEIRWIKEMREQGARLLNITAGGQAGNTGPCSTETRMKMSVAQHGRIFTDEHRAKLSASRIGRAPWNKGHALSDEHRAKLSSHVFSDEHRTKLSIAHKGHPVSDETRRKMSLANRSQVPWNKGLSMDTADAAG